MMPAWILAFCSGFLSLSFELLWVRLYSFVNYSKPQAFAFVLMLYLLGISIGASIGKSYCDRQAKLWRVSGVYLSLACVTGLIGPWIYVALIRTVHADPAGGLLIAVTAACIAVVFPIAHHLGTLTTGDGVGRSLSRVYVANIMGATLGPIFSGVLLLMYFTTQQAFFISSSLIGLLALCCFLQNRRRIYAGLAWIALSALITIYMVHPHQLMINAAEPAGEIWNIVENQYGIVVSYAKDKGGDAIYGGNVYDGRTNLDPVINSNGIDRILILPALQPQPKRVLMIGLSIGTWLALVNTFPNVEHIDVVEINPGYLTLIKDYPEQQQALQDPRVHLHIDDGRRWLKAHPEERYDLIVMNTTFYWRAYSTNLLSYEFLSLLKQHMNPHAVMTYNTTRSLDAFKTASVVFKHAYLYVNFVIAAEFDWRPKLKEPNAEKILASLQLDGKPVFPKNHQDIIQKFLQQPVWPIQSFEHNSLVNRPLEIVTDHNLITEYKYGLKI